MEPFFGFKLICGTFHYMSTIFSATYHTTYVTSCVSISGTHFSLTRSSPCKILTNDMYVMLHRLTTRRVLLKDLSSLLVVNQA